MATIAYYVHGRGRGHATRSEVGAGALREAGHHVLVRAGEDAMRFLDGASPIRSLQPGMGLATAPLFIRRLREDIRFLRDHQVDMVVSDSDMPSVLAARWCRRPSIAIGHGLAFSHCHRPKGLPARPWRREAWTAGPAAWTSDRQLVVNFIHLDTRRATAQVVAPRLTASLRDVRASRHGSGAPDDGRILCYFRDDNAQEVLEALVAAGARPLLFSARGGAPDGVEQHPLDRARFAQALVDARAVVASAGSQLMSECVALGKPLFALHGAHDREQRLNVAMLRSQGLGTGCAFEAFEAQALQRWLDGALRTRDPAEAAPHLPAEPFDQALVSLTSELLQENPPSL